MEMLINMKLFGLLILLFLASTILIGGAIYQSDLDSGNYTNIRNLTSNVTWENIGPTEINIGNSSFAQFASGIITRGLNFVGYSAVESIKLGAEFGYDHPEYNWEVLVGLIKIALIATIVAAASPLLLPLLAIITIIFMGAISLVKLIIKKCKGVKKNGKQKRTS